MVAKPPTTLDGRYIVVRGRLWRATNPALSPELHETLTKALMQARRAVGVARRSADRVALAKAGQAVDDAKVALGERGPAWWTDGAPDMNRKMVRNTPYADWFSGLPDAD